MAIHPHIFFSVNLYKIFVYFVVCGFISYLSSAFLHEMKWHFLPLIFFTFDLEELTMSVGGDQGLTGGTSGEKNLPANTGDVRDTGLNPGLGRFPGIRSGNSLQYSSLENSMDRGMWPASIRRVTKSQT